MQETGWSSKLTFSRERRWGTAPVNDRRVESTENNAGRLWFLGVDAQENPGVTPEARKRLCVCQPSFLMTLAMGRIHHTGSRQAVTHAIVL